MRLSDEDADSLGDILSHPRAVLDVGFDEISLRISGKEVSFFLLDDPYEQEDGDNPHGI